MSEYGKLLDEHTVRFERLLPGPIERVWSYIVDSDKRRKWLCAGDIGAGDGAHVDMHFHNESLFPLLGHCHLVNSKERRIALQAAAPTLGKQHSYPC